MPGESEDNVGCSRSAEIYAEAFADCVGRPNISIPKMTSSYKVQITFSYGS